MGLKHVKRPGMYDPWLRKLILKTGLLTLDVHEG